VSVTLEQFINYSPIVDRPAVKWPHGARVALWVAPNLEHYEYQPPPSRYREPWPRVPHPDVMNYAYRDYGNRVGFWRMLEVFDQYKLRGTVSLNMAVLEHFPEVGAAMLKRDWAFMSHGIYNTRYLFGMTLEDERAFYRDTIETLHRHTGRRLKGMLGPAFSASANTPDLMAEAGLLYHVDWFVDDQPFPINVKQGRLVGVPYSRELNDALLFVNPGGFEGDYFAEICKRQFDVLYEEGAESGRVMCIALHPYLIGQPHRLKYLAEALAYITGHDGVWLATGDEIAEHYLLHHHDAELARLNPSHRRT
jgi:peptidoglycan/xylan/chitin deacetylase (PgdA/CDA1 family)